MGGLLEHYDACRRILCETARRRKKIYYSDLAKGLGLKLARQRWSEILDPISENEPRDLTLVVVYKTGPAKNLSRYFSNIRGGQKPRTKQLNPHDPKQVSDYEKELAAVYKTYANLPC
jgi:hypothetical protein